MAKKRMSKNGGMNRREVIKTGLLAAGVALLADKSVRAQQFGGGSYGGGTNSPATTPFVDELPMMTVALPVSTLTPAPNPAAFQRYNEFLPQKFYDISVAEAQHFFHRDLPPSPVWGYNGI